MATSTLTYGAAVRARRMAAGLDQRDLAKAAGTSQSEVSRVERTDKVSDVLRAKLDAALDALEGASVASVAETLTARREPEPEPPRVMALGLDERPPSAGLVSALACFQQTYFRVFPATGYPGHAEAAEKLAREVDRLRDGSELTVALAELTALRAEVEDLRTQLDAADEWLNAGGIPEVGVHHERVAHAVGLHKGRQVAIAQLVEDGPDRKRRRPS